MGRRTKARECAMQMVYQWASSGEPMARVIEDYWKIRSTTDETRGMAERLAQGVGDHAAAIDAAIDATTKNWKPERIARIDRSIMRIGAYELFYEPQTPGSVVIDEAVEMAKRFSEGEAPSFVNGILDALMKKARGAKNPQVEEGKPA